MAKKLYIFLFLTLGSWAYAYDFKVANKDGQVLCYNIIDNESVALTYDVPTRYHDTAYKHLSCDTLYIPTCVTNSNKSYRVRILGANALSRINIVKVVVIPSSVDSIFYVSNSPILVKQSAFHENRLSSIVVDRDNPYFYSEDGILYTKDKKVLIAYPSFSFRDSVHVEEGTAMLAGTAFFEAQNIRFLELSSTLKSIGINSLTMDTLETLIIKDSVSYIDMYGIDCWGLKYLTLGKGVDTICSHFVESDSILNLYCRSITPPIWKQDKRKDFLSDYLINTAIVHVPRSSLHLYQQAEGWKEFTTILPIEPPIVTGVDTASVSWVQNFSATGYMWTLYTDEAKTQRFMSLTFDANGHLTHIDINSSHMPERMPALYHEDGEEEKRFAEYYSFTISGLSPDTKYYYTRQSLKGTEVIDEETGSFETLSNEMTGLNPCTGFSSDPQKMIKDGQVLIRSGNATYNLEGTSIRK